MRRLSHRYGSGLRRLRDLLRRRGPVAIVALALWLIWALLASALDFAGHALLLSVLLLGGVLFMAGGFGYLWLRRQQELESRRQQEYVWLSAQIRPRRPLPAFRGWMADPVLLVSVRELILEQRPLRVLELGSGLSTLVMAYALEEAGRGRLIALENNRDYAANHRQMLIDHGLEGTAQILDAPLQRWNVEGNEHLWYALDNLNRETPFGLLFVDGPAGYLSSMARYPALPLLRDALAAGSIIVLDDVQRQDEDWIVQRWLAQYPELRLEERNDTPGFAVFHLT